MARAAITKRIVDAAKPGGRDQFIWDGEVSGFGLKITPAGGKVYVFQYRLARPGEAERTPARRYTVGKHGHLTPDQARNRARELAALVLQGIDPRQRDLDQIAGRDEVARLAQKKARLEGELVFDTTKPNGTPRKLMDVSKLNNAGWSYTTELEAGIKLAYKDALSNGLLDS